MLIIGIAGGSGSGKSTMVKKITESLPEDAVKIIYQDAYYYDKGHLPVEEKKKINFDHPSSIEFGLLVEHIDKLKQGETIGMPVYSYLTCSRSSETIPVKPTRVIIVEGILLLSDPELRSRLDVKVYVDADSDDRLMRIILRDVEERGRSFKEVLKHYQKFVRPMHLQFIEPNKCYADIVILQGGKNQIGIDILTSHIKEKIFEDR